MSNTTKNEKIENEVQVTPRSKGGNGIGGKLVLMISGCIVFLVLMVPIFTMLNKERVLPTFVAIEDVTYNGDDGTEYEVCEFNVDDAITFFDRYGNPSKYWGGIVKDTYGTRCFKINGTVSNNTADGIELVVENKIKVTLKSESLTGTIGNSIEFYGAIYNVDKKDGQFNISIVHCEIPE